MPLLQSQRCSFVVVDEFEVAELFQGAESELAGNLVVEYGN